MLPFDLAQGKNGELFPYRLLVPMLLRGNPYPGRNICISTQETVAELEILTFVRNDGFFESYKASLGFCLYPALATKDFF